MTLLVAGHETTAAGLAWAIIDLANNPEALAAASAEARDGGRRWLDACVEESLRLNPPIAVVARRATRETALDGYVIAPGTMVLAATWLAYRRPQVWDEPDSYRPQRFIDRRYATSEYPPFGGGKHRCLGAAFVRLQARVTLGALLRRFNPRAVGSERRRRITVTFVPSRGARVRLEATR